MVAIASAFVFIMLFFFAEPASAWGPATHLELGLRALKHTAWFSAEAGALIRKFPYDFLYGNISADIVVGKNLVEELKHCHNWGFGWKLLKRAQSDSQKAFAYGYLSHLAADTVAHNHFIPEMTLRAFPARMLRHFYWEMRFDALANRAVWKVPKKIMKAVHRDNDRLLKATLEDAPLSFRTGKTIFSSILILGRVERWHRMIEALSKSSRWTIRSEEKAKYLSLSISAIRDVLSRGQRSHTLLKDPTGRRNLKEARLAAKKLRVVKRKGLDRGPRMKSSLKTFISG